MTVNELESVWVKQVGWDGMDRTRLALDIFRLQTLPYLRSSYFPEYLAQVKFCATRNSVYMESTV